MKHQPGGNMKRLVICKSIVLIASLGVIGCSTLPPEEQAFDFKSASISSEKCANWEMLTGTWYGEKKLTNGGHYQWIMTRFPNGRCRVICKITTPTDVTNKHHEGEWAVSKNIEYTNLNECYCCGCGEKHMTDANDYSTRAMYKIIKLTPNTFIYQHLDNGLTFKVSKVDDDFKIPQLTIKKQPASVSEQQNPTVSQYPININTDTIEDIIKNAENGDRRCSLALYSYYHYRDSKEALRWLTLAKQQAEANLSIPEKASYIAKLDNDIITCRERIATYELSIDEIQGDLELAQNGDRFKINFMFRYYLNNHEFDKSLYWLERGRDHALQLPGNANNTEAVQENYDTIRKQVLNMKQMYEFRQNI